LVKLSQPTHVHVFVFVLILYIYTKPSKKGRKERRKKKKKEKGGRGSFYFHNVHKGCIRGIDTIKPYIEYKHYINLYYLYVY
jgi:hypothetical protein